MFQNNGFNGYNPFEMQFPLCRNFLYPTIFLKILKGYTSIFREYIRVS